MATKPTMTISVHLRVTVDPEAYDLVYGTGTTREALTKDVKSYVLNHVQCSGAAEADAITSVRVI